MLQLLHCFPFDTAGPVYIVFAAWHRVTVGDRTSPWIQNDIRKTDDIRGEVSNNDDGSPALNIFKFEDLTGGEARDDDYDDMIMTVTFNY